MYAHLYNVSVEGEIGKIGGTEDELSARSCNAKKEDVVTYIESTNVDSVAPALGSVHGLYKGEPNLDFETMQDINESISQPLVLHGGTGIPNDKIKQAISCGISKININSSLLILHLKITIYYSLNIIPYFFIFLTHRNITIFRTKKTRFL